MQIAQLTLNNMKKIQIGDVFSTQINDFEKKYFQYISKDINQLNSDVIKVFDNKYLIIEKPDYENLLNCKIGFFAHTFLTIGIKNGLFKKEGNMPVIDRIDKIIFRSTSDYGTRIGEVPILKTNNWKFWNLEDNEINKFRMLKVDDFNSTYIGIVFNPSGILELLKGNKYPINYPSKL